MLMDREALKALFDAENVDSIAYSLDGGGVQYKLPASVQDLLDAGYLSRVGQ